MRKAGPDMALPYFLAHPNIIGCLDRTFSLPYYQTQNRGKGSRQHQELRKEVANLKVCSAIIFGFFI